jgi:hypothetical protein
MNGRTRERAVAGGNEREGGPAARELERVAPAPSRRRSSFVRAALRRALDEAPEARMAEAYEARPDAEPAHFDSRVWEFDWPELEYRDERDTE